LELRYSLFSQPGKLRLMGWANIANAGNYSDALALPVTTPNYPDITLTRQVRTNYGFVANLEQAITNDLGVFSRATWSPGLDTTDFKKTEWRSTVRSPGIIGAFAVATVGDRYDNETS
jgi:carbohydrate-selective porin (OprB family)